MTTLRQLNLGTRTAPRCGVEAVLLSPQHAQQRQCGCFVQICINLHPRAMARTRLRTAETQVNSVRYTLKANASTPIQQYFTASLSCVTDTLHGSTTPPVVASRDKNAVRFSTESPTVMGSSACNDRLDDGPEGVVMKLRGGIVIHSSTSNDAAQDQESADIQEPASVSLLKRRGTSSCPLWNESLLLLRSLMRCDTILESMRSCAMPIFLERSNSLLILNENTSYTSMKAKRISGR